VAPPATTPLENGIAAAIAAAAGFRNEDQNFARKAL